MNKLYYAGIGSRETPNSILTIMTKTAHELENNGWILRSGGAKGADQAFERGVSDKSHKEIFYANSAIPKSYIIASKYHPSWQYLSDYVQSLHARNVMQVLGKDLETPVEFVICWTPDGVEEGNKTTRKTGGTGQAIRIASGYGISIINLKNNNSLNRILEIINKYKK